MAFWVKMEWRTATNHVQQTNSPFRLSPLDGINTRPDSFLRIDPCIRCEPNRRRHAQAVTTPHRHHRTRPGLPGPTTWPKREDPAAASAISASISLVAHPATSVIVWIMSMMCRNSVKVQQTRSVSPIQVSRSHSLPTSPIRDSSHPPPRHTFGAWMEADKR